jgi:superfamily II DNA or RNA helicase
MPPQWRVGDHVRVRGDEWRIAQVTPGDACVAVALSGASRANGGRRLVLVSPFDRLERLTAVTAPRRTRFRSAVTAARVLAATSGPYDTLRTAASAHVLLLPHQLAPALAAVSGRGCRFLLADAVGLGKTIQAALILAELRARQQATRCLILTPVGLRDQWAAELSTRFHLESTIVDRRFVREQQLRFPRAVNPWTLADILITSLDYAKRPEVEPGLASLWWDLLIVDEAHTAATAADRGHLARMLAARSRRVVLLTATPHAGDARAFVSLCRCGELNDGPIVMFRRTRRDAGLPAARRVHLLRVRPTPAERQMHARLARYTQRAARERSREGGADAWLAMLVLNKRALSSAGSLARSTARRLRLLGDAAISEEHAHQLPLAFDPDVGDGEIADAEPQAMGIAALADTASEQRLLADLHEAAVCASRTQSKLLAIQRLLRRAAEPAIIFTEYRDTLAELVAVLPPQDVVLLHGGLSRSERMAAAQAFTSGAARILLATDAAGEGLNLHARCRLVINLELPWSPRRLEQRIGRVDRIGQRRTVHAIHLIAHHTGESRVLARLVQRLDRIREALDDPDQSALPSEPEVLEAIASPHDHAAWLGASEPQAAPAAAPSASEPSIVRTLDLSAEADREAQRLHEIRLLRSGRVPRAALSDDGCESWRARLDRRAPWIAQVPKRRMRPPPAGGGRLYLYRIVLSRDAAGERAAEEQLLPIWIPLSEAPSDLDSRLRQIVAAVAQRRRGELADVDVESVAMLCNRERAMGAHAAAQAAVLTRLTQQGLFDRRAVHAAERVAVRRTEEAAVSTRRLMAVEPVPLRLVVPRVPSIIFVVPGRRSRGGAP